MTTFNIAHEADLIVCSDLAGLSDEALRDAVDIATGGDLDCFQLDLLTDAVKSRLARLARPPRSWGGPPSGRRPAALGAREPGADDQ